MIKVNINEQKIFSINLYEPRKTEDESTFFQTLDQLKSEDQFGLILQVDSKASFSKEGKRKLTKWFKENKKFLKNHCYGMVRIATNLSKINRFKSKAISLAMPCPYLVETDKEMALKWLISKSKR